MTLDEIKIEQAKMLAVINQAVKNFEDATGVIVNQLTKTITETKTRVGVFTSFEVGASLTIPPMTQQPTAY